MDLAELSRVAKAMVAPGKGILAADEFGGTIAKRFTAIGVESTETSRRDYRELLFRSTKAMADRISGVILFDETIRQKAEDGTPLVKVIEQAGAIPGIKVDKGTKPLAFCPGETITEGLDGLRERLVEYRELGAKFCKWRAVIDIGPGIPSYNCISANAHALARYAALCQEENLVPIVEPEVLMDGDHDIGRCEDVTEFVLKTVFQELYYARVKLEGMVLKPNMVVTRQEECKAGIRRGDRRKDPSRVEGLRSGRRPRHRLSVGRPVGRRSYCAARRHEQDRRRAVAAQLLLRAGASGGPAENVVGEGRKQSGGAGSLRPSGRNERTCHAWEVGART